MFVDIAKIRIKAGNGGDGAVTFHREKYVASGGPDGGDGGKGGDIIFEVDDNLATLADFRYKRKYTAPDGKRGDGGRRRGKNDSARNDNPRGGVERRYGGYVRKDLVRCRKRRPRRLGQHPFQDPDPPDTALCKEWHSR